MTESRIVVDVKVSEKLDALCFVPREPKQTPELARRVRRLFPDGKAPRRTAEGVRSSAMRAATIVDKPPNLDLRLSDDAKMFLENRKRAKQVYPSILSEVTKIKKEGAGYALKLIEDSQGLNVLDSHQIVNVAAMTIPGGYGLCVFDEQGAGKTVTFIFALDLLVARDHADAALVVAPKSMICEWPQDFARFRDGLFKVKTVSGTRKQKRTALNSGADVLVTNFETAVSMEAELKSLLRSTGRRYVLAVDESFFIKSIDAKRTKIASAPARMVRTCIRLCGTPAPNSPQDLVQQFSIVDFGLTFGETELPDDREDAAPIVQKIIEERAFSPGTSRQKYCQTCQRRISPHIRTMAPVQKSIYESLIRSLGVDLEAITDDQFRQRITSFSARRSALLQTCSTPWQFPKDTAKPPPS